MEKVIRPADERELRDAIALAGQSGEKLAITAGGSKADVGRYMPDVTRIDMRAFVGVVDYDPAELVLTVRPATPLAQVQELVRGQRQMLAFDPFDHGPLFDRPPGDATIGGVVAAGIAGSRRITRGGARDHLLGFKGVSGRGESFIGGGRVVKNVTGYDLPKIMAGSWGRLAALTELTLKVLPRPRASVTIVVSDLDPERAVAAMAAALGSRAEISAAAHLPSGRGAGRSATILRLEGFEKSVSARSAMLADRLGEFGQAEMLTADADEENWSRLRRLSDLPADCSLWRIVLPARQAPGVTAQLHDRAIPWLMDWGGGLIWAAGEIEPMLLRDRVAATGGHAMLIRTPDEMRQSVPAFHPSGPDVGVLETRIRRGFDPAGTFETGRF